MHIYIILAQFRLCWPPIYEATGCPLAPIVVWGLLRGVQGKKEIFSSSTYVANPNNFNKHSENIVKTSRARPQKGEKFDVN